MRKNAGMFNLYKKWKIYQADDWANFFQDPDKTDKGFSLV